MLENLNSRIFSEHLHSDFQVRFPDSPPVTLQLIEVSEKTFSPRIEHFSVLFRGPLAPQFAQGIRAMEHEKLGKFDLFLVPVGPDGKGMCYQAVFNRLVEEKK